MMWALAHSPPRGVWGLAPPEKFGNLDSLRAILRHSESDFNTIPDRRMLLATITLTLAMQSIAHPVKAILGFA